MTNSSIRDCSTTACAVTLFQAGNDSAFSTTFTSSGRSSCWYSSANLQSV
jgi:hypothetical protein